MDQEDQQQSKPIPTTEKSLSLEIEVYRGVLGDGQQSAVPVPKSIFKQIYAQVSKVKWTNVIVLITAHLLAVVGYYYNCTHDIKLHTVFFAAFIGLFSGEYFFLVFFCKKMLTFLIIFRSRNVRRSSPALVN